MSKIKLSFLIVLSFLIFVISNGCNFSTIELSWVIDEVVIDDYNYYVYQNDLHNHLNYITTDLITLEINDHQFEFVDYYGNEHIGKYEFNKEIVLYFEDGLEVIANKTRNTIASGNASLSFEYQGVKYIFVEKNKDFKEFTFDNYQTELRKIGLKMRNVYNTDDYQCDHNSNLCADLLCKAELIVDGDKITLKCLKTGEVYELNKTGYKDYIYYVDESNLITYASDLSNTICVYRPSCNSGVAVYIFSE